MISLDPSYRSNPYIVASGLADEDRWPELGFPSSPAPSDDESASSEYPFRHGGFPGATGLKYTTTIMGPSRVGGAGLRVSGKRASISKASLGRRASRANSEPSIAVEVEHATPDAADSTPGMVANTNVNASASASSAKSAIVRTIEDLQSDS